MLSQMVLVHPVDVAMVRQTLNKPEVTYKWVGSIVVEVLPSPKSQCHVVMRLWGVLVSRK